MYWYYNHIIKLAFFTTRTIVYDLSIHSIEPRRVWSWSFVRSTSVSRLRTSRHHSPAERTGLSPLVWCGIWVVDWPRLAIATKPKSTTRRNPPAEECASCVATITVSINSDSGCCYYYCYSSTVVGRVVGAYFHQRRRRRRPAETREPPPEDLVGWSWYYYSYRTWRPTLRGEDRAAAAAALVAVAVAGVRSREFLV